MDNSESMRSIIRSGRVIVGTWLSIGDERVAEIIAASGFTFVTVDMEHTSIDLERAERLIRVVEMGGRYPLVRLSDNDPTQAKRVMDCGAHGIVVPMVNSMEEATRAVSSIYYPPRGIRGVGLYRAQKYGAGFSEYGEWLKEHGVVIVQIESREAIENLDDILSVDGVNGAIIGPYDLANSLGVCGELDHPKVIDAEQKFVGRCKKYGVAPGIHIVQADKERLRQRVKEGFRLIAYGVDMIFLERAARKAVGDGIECQREFPQVR